MGRAAADLTEKARMFHVKQFLILVLLATNH